MSVPVSTTEANKTALLTRRNPRRLLQRRQHGALFKFEKQSLEALDSYAMQCVRSCYETAVRPSCSQYT